MEAWKSALKQPKKMVAMKLPLPKHCRERLEIEYLPRIQQSLVLTSESRLFAKTLDKYVRAHMRQTNLDMRRLVVNFFKHIN